MAIWMSDQAMEGKPHSVRPQKKRIQYVPWCSAALTAINVLIFLACHIWGDVLYSHGSFSVVYLIRGQEYYRILSAMFLHTGIDHLFNNMILLYFGGEMVEKTIGKIRFLILYFVSGFCGQLLSAIYEVVTGSYYDSIGASGAVFGIVGGLFYLVLTRRGQAAYIPMRRMILMLLLSLYAGFQSVQVNNAAHLGGLLAGCLVTFVLCHIGRIPDGQRLKK